VKGSNGRRLVGSGLLAVWAFFAPRSWAWAQDAPAGPLGPLSGFVPFLLIFVLFYLLLILPQQRRQKKHRAMLEALKKNDKVATTGGIYGTVMSLTKDMVTLEIAPNVRIKIRRDAIADLRTGDDEESK
jgi:preprotein translocase subunit YajC